MTTLQAIDDAIAAIEQMLDDLSYGTMEFPDNGVCKATWDQAAKALTNLKAERERLVSEELVNSISDNIMRKNIENSSKCYPKSVHFDSILDIAKAAIETIRGEK